MDQDQRASLEALKFPSNDPSNPETTVISTIVIRHGTLQLLVALLQSGDIYNLKVIDWEPKLTFIGMNLDESVQLQKEHDELLRQLQEKNTPPEEMELKIKLLLEEKKPHPNVTAAMKESIELTWSDACKLLLERKFILDQNVNFHEKLEECRGKMSALEMSCRDTMIPIEIDSVIEYLEKFKQLRTDVLTTVMSALKEGSTLIDRLKRLVEIGSLDSRPEHIKIDALKAINQVEFFLEDLHDKRNTLELAWQTRKTQLEQCYTLAVLAKEIIELEDTLECRKNEILKTFSLGDSETTANLLLKTYNTAKDDARGLRDKAVKITKATEHLVSSGCFAGDQASHKAYNVLSNSTDYFGEIDRREGLLEQSKEFFQKAEKVLSKLESLEIEVSTLKIPQGSPEILVIHERILSELNGLIDEPVNLGNILLDAVDRKQPDSAGIRRTIEEMENRKIYLENVCSNNSEQQFKVSQLLNVFLERYNNILSWLVSIAEVFLRTNKNMGQNQPEARDFFNLHHQLLSDLEIKGSEVNNLLMSLPPILEFLEEKQRRDVDEKVESLHKHWIDLKNLIETRVDLVQYYINFHAEAEILSEMFDFGENMLKTTPEEERLKQFESAWNKIKPAYAQLKNTAKQFVDETSKVADPYLETKSACSCVEEILNSFSNRQFDITESWENWTSVVTTKRETETTLERIMTENVEVMYAATKLDAQLYPVLNFPTDLPSELESNVHEKLDNVLTEIENAQKEIKQRIETTSALQSTDVEIGDRIDQANYNLKTIYTKLQSISKDFKKLLEMIMKFLNDLSETKNDIEKYFRENSLVQERDGINIEKHSNDYINFRDKIMEKFRSLIQQSQTLVDQIKVQEPHGASEFDAERIISLLENLRLIFENQNSAKALSLKKQQMISQHQKDVNELNTNLDDMCRQLIDVKSQFGESSASAKATSLAFEYFEQTIEFLEKRIENLINTSENICVTYPDTAYYIREDIDKLNKKWYDFRDHARNTRRLIDVANEYFQLYDNIDTAYREHSTYLFNTVNKIPLITSTNQAADLIDNIENYIRINETPQMNNLKKLSTLSISIFGDDKTCVLYSDNVSLFQSFVKLKFDIGNIIVKFKSDEDERLRLEKDEVDRANEQRVTSIITEQVQHTFTEKIYESPCFIQPLRNAAIHEGDKVIFECVVTGKPEPKIEWFKDGISIQDNSDYHTTYNKGICTLSIEETFTEDSAHFTCKATNSVGTAETTATLTVQEMSGNEQVSPPAFAKYLESGRAQEGTSFEFHCYVTGNPLPNVQWFKNENCIDNSPDYVISFNNGDAVLKFEEVFLEDQALFTCKAVNPHGMVQSSASLSVEPLEPTELPYFKHPLSNIMARVGQKIKLECQVTGIPQPDLYWTHNGKSFNVRDTKLQYENEKAILVILEAFPKDAGIYTVTAKNLAGEASSSCNVSVKGRLPNETSDSELASDMEPIKPSVQLQLKDISIFEGKSIRLDCVIIGQPEPEVIWYHNNRPVKESQDFQLLFQGDRCSLLIQEAYIEDAGEYRVVAINSAGEASSRCLLSVIPLNDLEPATRMPVDRSIMSVETPPRFDKLLIDILAPEGDRVEFECVLSGDPKPTVKWFLNNKEIIETTKLKPIHQDDGTVKLIIDSVSTDDKGLYSVKAFNASGEAKCFSHLIVKSVNAPDNNHQQQQTEIEEKFVSPTFKELFTNKIVREDECTKFECIVIGKPTPKIKWFFNDVPVHGKDFLVSTSGNRQVLTIPKASSETIGKISCIAENDAGKATCVAYLSLLQETQMPTSEVQSVVEEHNTGVSSVTIKKQTFTTTSTSHVSSVENNGIPQKQIHTASTQMNHLFKQQDDQSPVIAESKQFQEYHQTNNLPPLIQQNSTITFTKNNVKEIKSNETIAAALPKPTRKSIAPRFVSPFVGKIVDQGADVVLEAILDGYPSPEIKLTKNGEDLLPTDKIKIEHSLNKVTVELTNVGIKDAGRYTCAANNKAGTSTSTADLVVKKSIFPPVFGRRLQAQVVKKGQRVNMDVEITGTPEPEVTWLKDNRPLNEVMISPFKLKKQGICHTLVIESAKIQDSGKYMVRAINAGGEAQSIADFAVLEPTPERMVEVVKTVVFDDVKMSEPQKSNSVSIDNTMEREQNIPSQILLHSKHQQIISESDPHSNEESTIVTETKRTTQTTMRMEHKLSFPDLSIKSTQNTQTSNVPTMSSSTMCDSNVKSISTNTDTQEKKTDFTQTPPHPPPKPTNMEEIKQEDGSIETSSISKQVAFDFFMNKLKTESQPVEKEKYTSYQELQKQISLEPSSPKNVMPINNKIETTKTSTQSKLNFELRELNLEPGPPPEVGFMPKQDAEKQETVIEKIQKLEETKNQLNSVLAIKDDNKLLKFVEPKMECSHETKTQTQLISSAADTFSTPIFQHFSISPNFSPVIPPEIEHMPQFVVPIKVEPQIEEVQKQQEQQLNEKFHTIKTTKFEQQYFTSNVGSVPKFEIKQEEVLKQEPITENIMNIHTEKFTPQKVSENFEPQSIRRESVIEQIQQIIPAKESFHKIESTQFHQSCSSNIGFMPKLETQQIETPRRESVSENIQRILPANEIFHKIESTQFHQSSSSNIGYMPKLETLKAELPRKQSLSENVQHMIPANESFHKIESTQFHQSYSTNIGFAPQLETQIKEPKGDITEDSIKFIPINEIKQKFEQQALSQFPQDVSPTYQSSTSGDVQSTTKKFQQELNTLNIEKRCSFLDQNISQIQKNESFRSVTDNTNTDNKVVIPGLEPGSPPEMGFMPEQQNHKTTTVIDQIQKLEDARNQLLDASSGGTKILPFTDQRKEFTHEVLTQERHEYVSSTESSGPIFRPQAIMPHQEVKLMDFRSPSPRPSAEGIAMEKLWASPKPHDTEQCQPVNFPSVEKQPMPDMSFQTFPKSTIKTIQIKTSEENTETIKRNMMQETKKIFEEKIKDVEQAIPQETMLRAPSLVKQITSKPPQHERPKSVTELLPDIYLEPGPPPEVCFAPKPEIKQSYVEKIEQELEKDIEKGPSRVLPGSVRTMPPKFTKENTETPPVPPRETITEAPPVPARPEFVPIEPRECFIPLEPFPFTVDAPQIQPPRPTSFVPPTTPSKFIKGEFTESDYETDNESRISAKWKPHDSDTDEPKYRPVKPPVSVAPRSRSTEPQPLPPSQFEHPTPTSNCPISSVSQELKLTRPISPPKTKLPNFNKGSGYMADTDEPFNHRFINSQQQTIHQQTSYSSEINTTQTQNYPEKPLPPAKHYRHHIHKHDKKDDSSTDYSKEFTTASMIKNISMTSKHIKYNEEEKLEAMPFQPDPPKPKSMKGPPPPSPSKFIKGEFRESDYESDYEGRIAPIWRPCDSDSETMYYKPVRPVLTPTGRRSCISDGARSPTPPTAFDNPPQFDGPPRPKFEPIEKPKHTVKLDHILQPEPQPQVFKPKPVSAKSTQRQQFLPTSPMKHVKYYTGIAGTPIHNQNYATETLNSMQMNESTETSHRIVNIQQTRRVIPLGTRRNNQTNTELEPFPYVADSHNYQSNRQRIPPPPTPTKFVRGEFRESDHESEIDSIRIRPVWTPNQSDSEEPQYRRVNAPFQTRASSLPRTNTYGRVMTPMEFDTEPPVFVANSSYITPNKNPVYRQHKTQTQTIDRYSTKKYQTVNTTRDDIDLKPGSPPKYGYINTAHNQIQNMNNTFKSKAQHFVQDIITDVQTAKNMKKPILKKTLSDTGEPQAYRDESRVSQYGTKHIDPDTGLIYFKYDFGYEFGIIFPGEGKKLVGGMRNGKNEVTQKMISNRVGDIEVPVLHENTRNGGITSDSEFSDNETKTKKRYSLPIQLNIDAFHQDDVQKNYTNDRNEASSDHSWSGPDRSAQSTPLSHRSNGHHNDLPKKPPIFITPLKDIAVVSGQTARFECIVQCDPHPKTYWSKNGIIINNDTNHVIEFRNGVCRLTVPHAYPDDAGTYTCTATNHLGSHVTSSELLVPGEKWGVRK